MFNHVRTLLLNRDGRKTPGEDFFGEELVPAGYRELNLPSYLDTVRARLFGADPDRAMLNYRLKQYLTILHSTELAEYVLALDPRITYDVAEEYDLALRETFLPQIRQFDGTPATLHIYGESGPPDSVGRLRYQHDIDVLLGDTIEIKRVTPYPKSWVLPLSLTNNLSPQFDLYGTGYRFSVNTMNPGTRFIVEGFLRPQWDLGQIVAMLQRVGETVIVQLLGIDATEPYRTLRNLWYDHPEMPYKLGAVLLAVAYRTEEVRTRG